ICALLIALVYRMLPESLPKEQRHAFHGVGSPGTTEGAEDPQFLLLSLSVGLAFGGLSCISGAAANFVMEILHLPETAFAWLFVPLISGMVIGSAWGGKRADKIRPTRMVWIGFGLMAAAAVVNVGYNALFVAEVPWAVLPLMVYTFGLAVAMPAIQVGALGLFPENRGLASSMLAFIQMMAFALVSGLVAPALFGSAFKLACGVLVGMVGSLACWRISRKVM
ncbi:Bcr/CflA family drug resistance efflux transporter, partial [Massilia cavernae]